MDREQRQPAQLTKKKPVLFWLLAALLLVLIGWSLVLSWRTHNLRGEVARGLEWNEGLQQARLALESARSGEFDKDSTWTRPHLLQLRYLVSQSPSWIDPPELSIAWKDLEATLANWPDERAREEDPDAHWRQSESALEALAQLESSLRERLIALHLQREASGNALLLLVLSSLGLAALHLGLFYLVQRRGQTLAEAHRDALEGSSHDALTGLWNRGTIQRLLGLELARARRLGVPVGLILADLDRFAEVNGLVGQEQGDFILEQVAMRMHSMVRPYDTLGRYGGDSFLLFLPACDESGTHAVAERLREVVNHREVEYAHGHLLIHMSLACLTVRSAESVNIDLLIRQLRDGIDRARENGPGRLHRVSEVY